MQSVSGMATYGYFCPNCGSLMYGIAESNPGKVSVKTGVLEGNGLSKYVPSLEINVASRAEWLTPQEGTTVFQKMPDVSKPNDV